MPSKNILLKPVLKWVGGKRQLLDDILPLIPLRLRSMLSHFSAVAQFFLPANPKKLESTTTTQS